MKQENKTYSGTFVPTHQEEEQHALIDALPQFVWIIRPDGSVAYTNQRWRDYSNLLPQYSREQEGFQAQHLNDSPHVQDRSHTLPPIGSLFENEIWFQNVHPEDKECVLDVWRQAFATGEPHECEYRLREGRTGAYRWFLSRGGPLRNKTGQIVLWFGSCTDIDEQKRTEEALRQSQERVSALMNSSIIGINIIEGEQIVDANDTFLRMTGYTREDLHAGRMNVTGITAPEYRDRTRQAYQELATQKAMMPYEKEYICQDGSRLPVLVGGVVLQRHPFQAIGFTLDNSARKELEQRKDDFISMASHELRTPLTAVKMQSQLVRRRLEKHSQHEAATALARVEMPIKQLERLIGELLDVSKIQAGRLEYVREPVDLDELLREVIDAMQHTSPSHAILVRGSAQTDLIGDRDRLRQVFTNLLSNAIKYAPDAKTVEVELSASSEAATISVHDQGIGIPRELQGRIFERFYRAVPLQQRAFPGLGMGLYIVEEIVKHHGGTIQVESEVGKGSTFYVTFPRAASREEVTRSIGGEQRCARTNM